jgi:L-arabinose isomerase
MNSPALGLLPLYIRLYDEVLPSLAAAAEPFVGRVAAALQHAGCTTVAAPICRTRTDFAAALAQFEAAEVDAVVALHLAYSPSLESAEVLALSPLPLLLLATTPDHDFGRHVDPQRLLYNHGVHGLQDLASVLQRLGKSFQVIAGHLDDDAFLPRVVAAARGARAARALRSLRTLRIGPSFPNMGDFAVPDAVLRQVLGVSVDTIAPAELAGAVDAVSAAALAAEMDANRASFRVECDDAVHARTVRVGLGLRATLRQGTYGAFSLNFLAFQDATGPVNTVPFLECCEAMARGLGYAGEGDVLTAALVGALAQGFGPANFTEIFCPDWAGGALFLSHMGEVNPAFAAARPRLYEKAFPFTPALNPATLSCGLRSGPATLVNLRPGAGDRFRLISAVGEILPDGTHPDLDQWIRGWIRPPLPLPRFLEEFSHLGGTHHSALLLGDQTDGIAAFASCLGVEHRAIAATSLS